jgi:hypothetical protein
MIYLTGVLVGVSFVIVFQLGRINRTLAEIRDELRAKKSAA